MFGKKTDCVYNNFRSWFFTAAAIIPHTTLMTTTTTGERYDNTIPGMNVGVTKYASITEKIIHQSLLLLIGYMLLWKLAQTELYHTTKLFSRKQFTQFQ